MMALLVIFVLLFFFLILFVGLLISQSPRPRPSLPSENTFADPFSAERHAFPLLGDDPHGSVDLSLIFPAYREQSRLPAVLSETVDYLLRRRHGDAAFSWEIIIVDDGSGDADATARIGLDECRRRGAQFWRDNGMPIRVCQLEKNRGKGGAVAQGMLRARGRRLLFLDSDGATKIDCLEQLERQLTAVAIGSRSHRQQAVARSWLRALLMHAFHVYVRLLGIGGVGDTQCGFKMFTRQAAAAIFPAMHVEGFIFDIELLLCAQWLGMPIAEVPVEWQEMDGSKVDLLFDSVRMARDLLIIRLNYALGIWKKPSLQKTIR